MGYGERNSWIGLVVAIASITVYLASQRNGYVTGANVNVDGRFYWDLA